MKSLKVLILSLGFFVLFGFNISNVSANESPEKLTVDEFNYLKNIAGFTEDEINNLPIEISKELIQNEAILENQFSDIVEFNESKGDSDISTYAELPSSKLKLTGRVIKVNSDWPGYKRYYAFANYEWLTVPTFHLTDGLAMGFPDSMGAVFKTSGGKVQGHLRKGYVYNKSTKARTNVNSSTTPSHFAAGSGIGGNFKLSLVNSLQSNTRNGGDLSQYFYIPNNHSGESNITFQYGHKRLSGSVSFTPSKSGVGISLTSHVDVSPSYVLTLSY